MKVKGARRNEQKQKAFIFNFYQRLLDTLSIENDFHNFGKCLENIMTVKQEQEHSMTRRQHFVVIVRLHLFGPFSSFRGTFKYHKIETKQAYYIWIVDFY